MVERLSAKKSRHGASRVAALLDQILEIVFSKPLLTATVIEAILDSSDALIVQKDSVWEVFVMDNLERLDSILIFGLLPLDIRDRDAAVQFMASHPRGLTLCAGVMRQLAQQHGIPSGEAKHESERYVSRRAVEDAIPVVLNRIREAAQDYTLLSMSNPMLLIWVWRQWTNADEVKSWISDAMKSDVVVLRLAELLPNISYQSGGDGRKEIRSFKEETYKDFLETDQFKARLNDIASTGSIEAQRIHSDFLAAVEAGKTSRF